MFAAAGEWGAARFDVGDFVFSRFGPSSCPANVWAQFSL